MEYKVIETPNIKIMEIISDEVIVRAERDALDMIGDAGYYEAGGVLLYEHNFTPAFFDLSTRIAGEFLQKFSTYRLKIAIVGDFSKYSSESLAAFIRESNRGNQTFFMGERDDALEKLAG